MRLGYRHHIEGPKEAMLSELRRHAGVAFIRMKREIGRIDVVTRPAPRRGWVECHVTVHLTRGLSVSVEAIDSDAPTAVRRAVEQAARAARLALPQAS